MPIGPAGGAAPARVDDDELDTAAAHPLELGPEMDVGGDEVGAPGDDEVRMLDRFRVGAADRPHGHVPGGLAAGVAHRPGAQPAGAERVKEAVQQVAVQLPLMRAVSVAEDRQRPRFGDDRLPTGDDLVERLVPADRRKLPGTFRPDPAQRGFEALGRMHELGVAVDLGAGKAGGERMVGIAVDPYHPPVLDPRQQRAHVGAIMRAHHPHRFQNTTSRSTGRFYGGMAFISASRSNE